MGNDHRPPEFLDGEPFQEILFLVRKSETFAVMVHAVYNASSSTFKNLTEFKKALESFAVVPAAE